MERDAGTVASHRDPQMMGGGVTRRVRDDLLHTLQHRVGPGVVVDLECVWQLEMNHEPARVTSETANRSTEIDAPAAPQFADDITHVAEQQARDRMRLTHVVGGLAVCESR